MKYFKCENCGSKLTKNQDDTYSCGYCKRTYYDDSLDKAYKRVCENLHNTMQGILTDELLKQKIEQIANCRQALYKARNGQFIDSGEVLKWSEEILKLTPDDAQANFYAIATKKRWGELNQFMQKLNAREVSYLVEGFVDYLTNGQFVERCVLALNDLISRAFDFNSKEYLSCHKKISQAAENEKSGVFDVELSRDVFVAYSSKDKDQAYALVEYLEESGFSCFIAMRNLAKGVDAELQYNDRLKKAIDNCQVFVLVSSKNSRSRDCDAYNIEMRYVKEQDTRFADNPAFANAHYEVYLESNRKRCKPRVEYLIEEYGISRYEQEVKKFFGGLTWCTDLNAIADIVFNYVENAGLEEEKLRLEEERKRKENEEKLRLEEERKRKETATPTPKIEEVTDLKDFEIENDVLKKYKGKGGKVVIPNSVTSSGDNAFWECSRLTSVVIPNSVTSIDAGAFRECWTLTSVVIPNSVTSIGNSVFYGCSSLTSVEIPNSVTSIGHSAFENCTSLTSVVIPDSVTSISDYAFKNCTSLTSVVIPDSVTSIGDNAFWECSRLTSVVIPNSVTSIGNRAFQHCSSLTSVEIPNSVTSIGFNAFTCCSSLTSVEIPNSVTTIGRLAFSLCSGLRKIYIPKSVETIESDVFAGTREVTIYTSHWQKPKKWKKTLFSSWNPEKRPVVWGSTKKRFDESKENNKYGKAKL